MFLEIANVLPIFLLCVPSKKNNKYVSRVCMTTEVSTSVWPPRLNIAPHHPSFSCTLPPLSLSLSGLCQNSSLTFSSVRACSYHKSMRSNTGRLCSPIPITPRAKPRYPKSVFPKTGWEYRWQVWSSGKGLVLCWITGTHAAAPWSFLLCGGVGLASSASSRALVGFTEERSVNEWVFVFSPLALRRLHSVDSWWCGQVFHNFFQQLPRSFRYSRSDSTATLEPSADVHRLSINNAGANVICRWLSSQPYIGI